MKKSHSLILMLFVALVLPLAAQEMPHGEAVKSPTPTPQKQKKTCAYCGIEMRNVTYPWMHFEWCPYYRAQNTAPSRPAGPTSKQIVAQATTEAITTAIGQSLANDVSRAIDEYAASASKVYVNKNPGESAGEKGRYVVGVDELSLSKKVGVYDNTYRTWKLKAKYKDLRLLGMDAAIAVKGDKVGLIDWWSDREVVPFEYDIWSFERNCYFAALGRYTGTERNPSIAEIRKHSLWGVWDDKGKNIVPVEYDSIQYCSLQYGDKWVLSLTVFKNGMKGLCDYDGVLVLKPEYSWVSGVRKVQGDYCIGAQRDRLCGLYDAAGKALTEHKYPWMSVQTYGVVAREQGRGTYGMLDGKGRTVIPFEFDTLRYFDAVDSVRRKIGVSQLVAVEKNGQWGVRSIFGQEILKVRYPKDFRALNLAMARVTDYSYSWYLRKRAAQIIDTKGEFETTAEFEARKKDPAVQQNFLENELKDADRDFLKQQVARQKISLLLGEYNADQGCFKIITPGYTENSYQLYIKREDAKQFKESFGAMKEASAASVKLFVHDDALAVAWIQFVMPDGRTYDYIHPALEGYDGKAYSIDELK